MNRNWLGLVALVVASFVGNLFSRSSASSVDRERMLQGGTQVVAGLPTTIGPWRSAPAEPMADDALRTLQCRSHASLTYVNSETGEQVSLLLFVGGTGPLIAHTPQTCFESARFEMLEAPRSEKISASGGAADTFGRVTFRNRSDTSESRRVYHAWHRPHGFWEVPDNPGLSLGAEPMLYKLQLATRLPAQTTDATPADDAARRLLDELLPVLNALLNHSS